MGCHFLPQEIFLIYEVKVKIFCGRLEREAIILTADNEPKDAILFCTKWFKFIKHKYIKIKDMGQERKKVGRSVTISEYFMLSNKSLRV